MTLIQEIIDQAKNNPDSIAIQGADYVISYKELLHVAYGYANSIDVKDSWIAIDTKLDWKFYAAILACWITGNGYVPIDFNFPKSRIQEIESQVNWLMLINVKRLIYCLLAEQRGHLKELQFLMLIWHLLRTITSITNQ
jgi:acyl-CoA synthetase (AMP-forming)/AMP-acid ligase II